VRRHDGLRLDEGAAAELQEALKQMDLLLQTGSVDGGLRHLIEMIRSLQALRRGIH